MNAAAAAEVGVTLEDVQGVLVAIAPIVGTPRVLAGAGGITRALGFAVAGAEAEIEAMLAEAEAEAEPNRSRRAARACARLQARRSSEARVIDTPGRPRIGRSSGCRWGRSL